MSGWWRLAALSVLLAVALGCAPAAPAPGGGPAAGSAPAKPAASAAGSAPAKPALPAQAAPTQAPPAVAGAAPTTDGAGAWQPEWERVLTAAKHEGKVIVNGPPGDTTRQALTAFQQAYPDITVEYTGTRSADFIARVLTERQAGQYLADVHVGGTGGVIGELMPAGAVDPLKPALIRPEVLDDSLWFGGFDWGFMDTARQRVFSFASYVSWTVFINRDVIPSGEFSKLEDLLDPKYRGRISINEPRDSSAGAFHSVVIIQQLGVEGYRKLLTEQDISVHRDTRQQVEALVRGTRPIGIGVSGAPLIEFQRQGLGQNVRPLDQPEASALTGGFGGCACLMNRAAHPNAARVYMDWLLGREGQGYWSRAYTTNSRRLDVEPADPTLLPQPGVEYLYIEREENRPLRDEQFRLAREFIR
jgi:iron(III) transport system substrate-binding protein